MSTINYSLEASKSHLSVPLLDLQAQYASIKPEIERVVAEVFESQRFILGPHVEECETAVADYSQCEYGIGVSSGTDALLVCLMAAGIGHGDEVITTPYSFFATAGCIARVGAMPVFIDIDPQTFNLDPALIEQEITSRTKAIIPVHLYGQMADMDAVMNIANRRKLLVIEDAAQAIGAEYQGRRAGSIGHYGCFSFFPSKNLGAAGDGGMVVTNDADQTEKLRSLRNHGAKPKYFHQIIGGNFRLDALQAAVVTIKLRHLDIWTAQRQQNASHYDELFDNSGLVEKGIVGLPMVSSSSRHIFNQYVIRVPQRDALRSHLTAANIGTEIYYPRPLHLQKCFANLGYQASDLPNAERAATETLALPIFPELTEDQLRYIVDQIAGFYEGK